MAIWVQIQWLWLWCLIVETMARRHYLNDLQHNFGHFLCYFNNIFIATITPLSLLLSLYALYIRFFIDCLIRYCLANMLATEVTDIVQLYMSIPEKFVIPHVNNSLQIFCKYHLWVKVYLRLNYPRFCVEQYALKSHQLKFMSLSIKIKIP